MYTGGVEKSDLAKGKLPETPGVYFFLGSKKEILYIGKATSLKNRVQSYFAKDIA
ncbi:MAG: excinuclease ABC subunit C, partial [Acidimicrobiales bacterium]